jgi:hypothetical protein
LNIKRTIPSHLNSLNIKRTIPSHLNSLNIKKRPQQTTWEIHVLAYDKYRNLAGLSQFVHGIQERIELLLLFFIS